MNKNDHKSIAEYEQIIEALQARLRHLLKSKTVQLFDEVDPRTREYKRDIGRLDTYGVNYKILEHERTQQVRQSEKGVSAAATATWHTTAAYPHWLCCSSCHKKFLPNVEWLEAYNIPANFCPNCGAKMAKHEEAPDA